MMGSFSGKAAKALGKNGGPLAEKKITGRECEFFNGFGGFVAEGREYEILLQDDNMPPAPWVNVIANENFGFFVSESGRGSTWAGNSHENKITPWNNDPVSDTPSEAIYIKDEETGELVTPMPLGRKGHGEYLVRHGFGYSIFCHEEELIEQELKVFTPLNEPMKIWVLKLKNSSDIARRLSLVYYVEWVLGVNREDTAPYIVSSYDNEYEYLAAKNIYSETLRTQSSFIFSSEDIISYTGDRKEFFGIKGSINRPEGLWEKLSCTTGVGYDPCGVIQVAVKLLPGEVRTIVFALGQSTEGNEISMLIKKYKDLQNISSELQKIEAHWNKLLGVIKVKTSDRALDILVNGWLLYQTVSCRLNARAAFYQCGGAYGFRDQLQDVLALLDIEPERTRRQILLACKHQFEEGDVQHWWHPPGDLGVRTRITDDLLWLPYVTSEYIKSTGDYLLLKEKTHYIKGDLLEKSHNESMFVPKASDINESVYEHCKRAIIHTQFGKHGIPLMGTGDWNDGMDKIGVGGRGESVWLGWFLYSILEKFIPICYHENDVEFANEQEKVKAQLLKHIEEYAWDGNWYIRAFNDNYQKIGSSKNIECKIDSISQSWSVLSGGAEKKRGVEAIHSAHKYLVKEQEGISLLLYPPFDKTVNDPGYIRNYYPGIRENGGQYSHAAVWLAMACIELGEYCLGYKLFTMLNPIYTTLKYNDVLRYKREPYIMTADISSAEGNFGKGGWSWYTGSASWMYQGLVKTFLGIKKEGEYLTIIPSVPDTFGEYTVWYKYGCSFYEIQVGEKGKYENTVDRISVDGVALVGNKIKLLDDGKKHIIVVQTA